MSAKEAGRQEILDKLDLLLWKCAGDHSKFYTEIHSWLYPENEQEGENRKNGLIFSGEGSL